MLPETHSFIVRESLNLTGKKFKGYEKHIEKGSVEEDNVSFNYDYFQIYGLDHFYHPIKKKGYFSFFGNAKQKGLSYFNKSVKLYKEDKEKSFIFLGKALHMLADIASPSHTKLEFHLVDIFEHYINNNIPKFKFKFKSKIMPRISSEHCFDRLARISYRVKYKKKFLLDTLHLLGIKIDKHRHQQLHKISNRLLSNTIIYSAILLSIFHQKTRKKRAKEQLDKIRTKAKRLRKRIKV